MLKFTAYVNDNSLLQIAHSHSRVVDAGNKLPRIDTLNEKCQPLIRLQPQAQCNVLGFTENSQLLPLRLRDQESLNDERAGGQNDKCGYSVLEYLQYCSHYIHSAKITGF